MAFKTLLHPAATTSRLMNPLRCKRHTSSKAPISRMKVAELGYPCSLSTDRLCFRPSDSWDSAQAAASTIAKALASTMDNNRHIATGLGPDVPLKWWTAMLSSHYVATNSGCPMMTSLEGHAAAGIIYSYPPPPSQPSETGSTSTSSHGHDEEDSAQHRATAGADSADSSDALLTSLAASGFSDLITLLRPEFLPVAPRVQAEMDASRRSFFLAHGPFLLVAFLGVDPSQQGRGLGSKLLKVALDRADAAGQWAYLEATNERNAELYKRHGFEVIEVKTWPVPGLNEPHKLILMARKPVFSS